MTDRYQIAVGSAILLLAVVILSLVVIPRVGQQGTAVLPTLPSSQTPAIRETPSPTRKPLLSPTATLTRTLIPTQTPDRTLIAALTQTEQAPLLSDLLTETERLVPAEFSPALDLPVATLEQVQEARDCILYAIPQSLPQTACDWAAVAALYAEGLTPGTPAPRAGLYAFVRALELNPAVLFRGELFYPYFGQIHPLGAFQLDRNQVSHILVSRSNPYTYEHNESSTSLLLNEGDEYEVLRVITRRDSTDSYPGPEQVVTNEVSSGEIPGELLDTLYDAVEALAPVPYPISYSDPYCLKTTPVDTLSVQITLTDGESISVSSLDDFLLPFGPWRVTVDGQDYIQYSLTFTRAVQPFLEALDLLPDASNPGLFQDPALCDSVDVDAMFDSVFSAFLRFGEN